MTTLPSRFPRWVPAALLAGGLFAWAACRVENGSPPTVPAPPPEPAAFFRDRTPGSGVEFTHRNDEEADHYAILESLGGGVGLLDYDGDGLLDIYLTGGGFFAGPDKRDIKGYPNRLYRNLGGFRFQDVTKEAGLDGPLFYNHGCAVTDYDRDGWPDLLVTGWGRLVLYHNEPASGGVDPRRPARRFVEVTAKAGLTTTRWSTGAAFGDLDGDGWPDLYVCHYLDWSFHNHPSCPGLGHASPRDICSPKRFKGLPDAVYQNRGDGTFVDVSKEAGLRHGTEVDGKGLCVLLVDLNDDQKPDVYVANDTDDNFLYCNRGGKGKLLLEEVGLRAGVARDDQGRPNGSMGVDAADYDRSGRPSVFVANYEGELHALYRNEGNEFFLFSTVASGIAAIGQVFVGFGTGFFDFDRDGWEDLVISNGHVYRHPNRAPLRQRPVLFRNRGHGKFQEVSRQAGPYFQGVSRGRGLAIGDLDNDGRPDLVICHLNEPAVLLRNEAGADHHWLGVTLAGANRADVVGAKVTLEADGARQTRFAKSGVSYLSSGDPRHVFGLGKAYTVGRLTVKWPSGKEQTWEGLAVDRYWQLTEGQVVAQPGP